MIIINFEILVIGTFNSIGIRSAENLIIAHEYIYIHLYMNQKLYWKDRGYCLNECRVKFCNANCKILPKASVKVFIISNMEKCVWKVKEAKDIRKSIK